MSITDCVGLSRPELARAIGIAGSGAWFGLTISTSTVIVPMILRCKGLTPRQRVQLWNDNFDLSVKRWMPIGWVGALGYFYAGWIDPRVSAGGWNSRLALWVAGGAMVAMIPLTVAFIFPSVFRLKNELKKENERYIDEVNVTNLIRLWDSRHRARIYLSAICFFVGVYDLAVQMAR